MRSPSYQPIREMNLLRPFFSLLAAGRKTVEVRVRYPKLRDLTTGDHIRFICESDEALTVVKRVSSYATFEEMLDGENLADINPDLRREEQLDAIRHIYGPEKESLGVLAIEIELLNQTAGHDDDCPENPGTEEN